MRGLWIARAVLLQVFVCEGLWEAALLLFFISFPIHLKRGEELTILLASKHRTSLPQPSSSLQCDWQKGTWPDDALAVGGFFGDVLQSFECSCVRAELVFADQEMVPPHE